MIVAHDALERAPLKAANILIASSTLKKETLSRAVGVIRGPEIPALIENQSPNFQKDLIRNRRVGLLLGARHINLTGREKGQLLLRRKNPILAVVTVT